MDYITIIKGDDTNFLEDQFVVVSFNTDYDLSGFTATFQLGDVTLTYGDLSSKRFEIILSSEITSNLKLGKQYGELKLIDTNNKIRTITSVIPFLVKNGVNEQITYINNSLNITTYVNETTIDISVETAGIAKTDAENYVRQCNTYMNNALSSANSAENAKNEILTNAGFIAVSNDFLTNNYIQTVANDLDTDNTIGVVSRNINNVNTVANINEDVTTVAQINSDITNVSNISEDVVTVSENNNAVSICAENIDFINTAPTNANKAYIWAEGTDEQVESIGGVHSAKKWAEVSADRQIQSDWEQADNNKKDFIKNKPTIIEHYIS